MSEPEDICPTFENIIIGEMLLWLKKPQGAHDIRHPESSVMQVQVVGLSISKISRRYNRVKVKIPDGSIRRVGAFNLIRKT